MLRTPHERIVPTDGLGPLDCITSWPVLRYLDGKCKLAGETGSVLVKMRKARIAGADTLQQSLWEAGVAA